MSVNSLMLMGSCNPFPSRGYAALYPEDSVYQKVICLVKERNFDEARTVAGEISDPGKQWDAKRLIATSIEELSPPNLQ